MSRIVVIHGMNQQYQSELELQERCRLALRSGCLAAQRARGRTEARAQLPVPSHESIQLAYYGDLFRSEPSPAALMTSKSFDEASALDEGDDELTGAEMALLEQFAGTAAPMSHDKGSAEPRPASNKGFGAMAMPQSARATDPKLISVMRQLVNALGDGTFAEATARVFVKQLYRYVTLDPLASQVLARVGACVTDETQLIIGHSMGTIIAYEFLRTRAKERRLTLLTLGSPFGIPFVYRHPRIMGDDAQAPAAAIDRWINVFDPRDPVVLTPNLSGLFSDRAATDQVMSTHSVNNGRQAHVVERYLNAAKTGEFILTTLGM